MTNEKYFATVVYQREIHTTELVTLDHLANQHYGERQENLTNVKMGLAAFYFTNKKESQCFAEKSEKLEDVVRVRLGKLR